MNRRLTCLALLTPTIVCWVLLYHACVYKGARLPIPQRNQKMTIRFRTPTSGSYFIGIEGPVAEKNDRMCKETNLVISISVGIYEKNKTVMNTNISTSVYWIYGARGRVKLCYFRGCMLKRFRIELQVHELPYESWWQEGVIMIEPSVNHWLAVVIHGALTTLIVTIANIILVQVWCRKRRRIAQSKNRGPQ